MIGVLWDGLRRARPVWRQLVAADMATRVAATLLIAPAVAFVVRAALARAGGGALTDQDILWFALSPAGIGTLLLVGAGSAVAGLVGHTAIMTVLAGVQEDRAVSWLDGMRHAGRRFFAIFEMAVRGLARLLLDGAPFLTLAGGAYLLLLRTYDINYYLSQRPPSFWIAALVITVAMAGLAWFAGRRLLGWVVALPRMLFGGASPAGALRDSAAVTANRRGSVLGLILVWGAVTLMLSALVTGAAGILGRWLVPETSTNLAGTAAGIGVAVVFGGVANLAVSVIGSTSLAALLFSLDRRWSEPWTLPNEITAAPASRDSSVARRVPGWAWLVAAIVVPLGAVALGLGLLRDVSVDRSVLITAHRGASGRAPENTLAAIRAAIADSADFVEIDVQETSDGVVVVHHDEDFMRAAGDAHRVWESTWSEVAEIPNGAWFAVEFEGERVATLEEVLRVAKDRIRVNIELKVYGHGQRLEERTIELVESTGMEDQVVLMSLDRPTVETLSRLRPDWTVGLLAAVSVGDLTRLDADFLAVNTQTATPGFIRRVHASGKEVQVWTVDNPTQMASLISSGVDVIITNEPALARDVLRRFGELSPVERLLLWAGARFGVVPEANVSSDVTEA